MNREILFRGNISMQLQATSILMEHGCMAIFVIRIIFTIKVSRVNFWLMKIRFASIQDCMTRTAKRIWENDILMCHDNPKDLVKAVFGEFNVIEVESEEVIDSVIGWHYEVIPTDELSKCEPFCYSMPLTDTYIKLNEMEVVGNAFDNPELLEEENVHGTD